MHCLVIATPLFLPTFTSTGQTSTAQTGSTFRWRVGYSFATIEETAAGRRMTAVVMQLDNGVTATADEAVVGRDGIVNLLGPVQVKLFVPGTR